ncbi:MAG: hypothetical protein ACLU84_07645 [Clostridia bacterium]
MEKNKKHSLKITFILISILVVLSIIILLFVPTIQEYYLYTQLKEKEQELSASSNLYYEIHSHYLNNSADTTDHTTKIWYKDGIYLKDNNDRFFLIYE